MWPWLGSLARDWPAWPAWPVANNQEILDFTGKNDEAMGFMKVLSDPEVDGRWKFGQIVPYFGDVVTFPSSTPRSLQYDIYIYTLVMDT